MKTSKKMLSLLLIAAMLVSVLCMGVSASDTTFEPVSISEGEPVKIVWIAKGFASYNLSDTSITPVAAGDWKVTSSAEHVYINGVAVTGAASGYTLSVVSGQLYQIITQNGTEAPIVAVVKGK